MKKLIFLIIASLFAYNGFSQGRADYDTAVARFQRFYNVLKIDSVFNMFSPRIQSLMPMEKTTEMLNDLTTQLGDLKTYEFKKADGHLEYYKTAFTHADLTLVVSLNAEKKLETFRFIPYDDAPVTKVADTSNLALKSPTGTLYGTLSTPQTDKKAPVVLLIAGSGPTDRNGNSTMGVKGDVYRKLADSLLLKGIACARYDKRGIGESAAAVKDEDGVTFDDMINDAVGFAKMLKTDPRFSKVIVAGHSEGSLIGMMVAQKAGIAGYISISGIASRADKIIEKQIATQSKELAGKATLIFDSLNKGYIVQNIDPNLVALFRPSVQQYMMSWLRYVPEQEIKKLKIPVLIVQGTTDLQVSADEAQELKKACPKASLQMIKGMNHVLKQAPADRKQNLATYTDADLPLCPGLATAIERFIAGTLPK